MKKNYASFKHLNVIVFITLFIFTLVLSFLTSLKNGTFMIEIFRSNRNNI